MRQEQVLNRHSRQREAVKDNILNRLDHPTAKEVYLAVREVEPRISLATVYRNLDHFVDQGLVEKFMVPGEPDHYDPVQREHYHVYCRNCLKVCDIDIQLIDYFSQQVKAQTGMDMHSLQVIASGICEDCKYKSESKGE